MEKRRQPAGDYYSKWNDLGTLRLFREAQTNITGTVGL